jgi:hypothetical protein
MRVAAVAGARAGDAGLAASPQSAPDNHDLWQRETLEAGQLRQLRSRQE